MARLKRNQVVSWAKNPIQTQQSQFNYLIKKASKTIFGKDHNFSESMSPLGNAGAVDCANYCVAMFSDLTKYVTMQNLFHDGGFSCTGVSAEVMEKYAEGE